MAKDKKSKRDYLLCDYNRDGDSYRCVWQRGLPGPAMDGSGDLYRGCTPG